MLRNLNDEIEECRRYAEDCRRRAQAATDPVLRAELTDIEERWLYTVIVLVTRILFSFEGAVTRL